MAITRQSLTRNESGASPLTTSVTVNAGSDKLMLVAVHLEGDADGSPVVNTVKFGAADDLTFLGRGAAADWAEVEWWYKKEPTVQTANVVVTLNEADSVSVAVYVLDGVDQTDTFRSQTAAAAWQASGTLLGALTTADVTPVIPAHQADDILVCITSNRVTSNTCATPSGWTLLHGPVDSTGWRTYVFWKRATSGSETNPLCDWTATSADKYAQVHTIRGAVKTGSPFAASALVSDVTDPIVNTGITTTVAGQLVVVIGIGSDNASASVTVTSTDPSSYTQRHFSTIATGADATGSFHDNTRATAGATGNVTSDHNSTMPAMARLLAAIIPEPASLLAVHGSGTSSTLTLSNVVSGDYLVDALTVDATGHSLVAGANQTEEYDDPNGTACDTGGSTQAGADGGAMSWTWTTSGSFGHAAVAVIPAAGGGTDHEVPIDDTLSLSDALAFEQGKVLTESVGLADALAFQRAISVADTVGLADALAFTRELFLTDTVGLSDSIAAERGVAVAINDSVTMSDNVVLESGKGVDIADTVGLADALAFDRGLVIADNVTLADALAKTFNMNVADAVAMADAITPAQGFNILIVDSAAVADFISPVLTPGGGPPPTTKRRLIYIRQGFYRRGPGRHIEP